MVSSKNFPKNLVCAVNFSNLPKQLGCIESLYIIDILYICIIYFVVPYIYN